MWVCDLRFVIGAILASEKLLASTVEVGKKLVKMFASGVLIASAVWNGTHKRCMKRLQ